MVVFSREQSVFSFGGWALATSHHAGLALAGRGWGEGGGGPQEGGGAEKQKVAFSMKNFNLGIASN